MATGEPSPPDTTASAKNSAPAKSGLWPKMKDAIIRIEQDFAVLKISILSVLGTLVVAYFQDLSAYQNKVAEQAKDDMTAATNSFTQASSTLSKAVTLQALLFYNFERAAALKVGDDKNALTSKNAQDIYKAYEDTAADLNENVNLLARQVEINLDWASDVERDPAAQTTFGSDRISTSFLGTVGYDCDLDKYMPKFDLQDHTVTATKGKNSLDIDWYSAKHHVFTIAYCFQTTHKTWMEPVRQWASQSTLNQAAIDEFLAKKTDQQLQARLDKEVIRLNDFMSRAMNEIEGIRVKYRPTSFYCDLPGVSQALDFFGKMQATNPKAAPDTSDQPAASTKAANPEKPANPGASGFVNPCTPIRLRV
ncbi:MAG TPA: hypothetical protein VHX43_00360 [Xanthobacteraceae bacterium]|nr:hypothetical protein [Xanthobacteraceae bacterium]